MHEFLRSSGASVLDACAQSGALLKGKVATATRSRGRERKSCRGVVGDLCRRRNRPAKPDGEAETGEIEELEIEVGREHAVLELVDGIKRSRYVPTDSMEAVRDRANRAWSDPAAAALTCRRRRPSEDGRQPGGACLSAEQREGKNKKHRDNQVVACCGPNFVLE